MTSVVINLLLLSVIFLILGNLGFSMWRRRRRYVYAQPTVAISAITAPAPRAAFLSHAPSTRALSMQQGLPIAVQESQQTPGSAFTLPSSWYTRHRTLLSTGLLLMLFLTLFIQNSLADGAFHGLDQTFSFFSFGQSTSLTIAPQNLPGSAFSNLTVSQRIARVNSADSSQYYNSYQLNNWSWTSCSGISLEEVMNAYGRHLIASDVLQVELNLGVWNTYQGLTGGEKGMAEAANYFGFQANANPPRTLAALLNIANKGFPVIVGVPDHILVVRGGDSNYVYLVDSAPANRTIMTHAAFVSWWNGFSVLITPR